MNTRIRCCGLLWRLILVLCGVTVVPGVARAQTWNETSPDAPEALPGDVTTGAGTITRINGAIGNGGQDADIYKIRIIDPATFSATTVGQTSIDSALFLFDSSGRGVTFNDDSASSVQSTITGQFVSAPGVYYLAIAPWDYDPRSATGDIWLDTPYGTERAPDGPGAADVLIAWSGTSTRTGAYGINLTGAGFFNCDVDTTPVACCMPDGSCTLVSAADCAVSGGFPQAPGSDCTTCTTPVACCLPDGSCTLLSVADCVSSGGFPQPPGSTCATCNCPAAADYADLKAALVATAVVRYEYGASLVPRPRMLATLIALRRVAAANPNITPAQLNAFFAAYDARLRAAIPGDPDLVRGINLMVAVRFPTVDLAPVPADILRGIDTEIDLAVLQDLGLDPYDTVEGRRDNQMETFALAQSRVGFLGESGVVSRSLYKLFRGLDAQGGFHFGLVPAALAYLATQPTFDSTAQMPMTINPFPTRAVLASRYPAVATTLAGLPPTPEEFAARAALPTSDPSSVAAGVFLEVCEVTAFVDRKADAFRALMAQGAGSLTASRTAAQNASMVLNAINGLRADRRELAERRAAIDMGTLAMIEALPNGSHRPLMLQTFTSARLAVAGATGADYATAALGGAEIGIGIGLLLTGGGAANGVGFITSGIGTLIPVFDNSETPEDQILDGIADIQNQMAEFQLDMQMRFN